MSPGGGLEDTTTPVVGGGIFSQTICLWHVQPYSCATFVVQLAASATFDGGTWHKQMAVSPVGGATWFLKTGDMVGINYSVVSLCNTPLDLFDQINNNTDTTSVG